MIGEKDRDGSDRIALAERSSTKAWLRGSVGGDPAVLGNSRRVSWTRARQSADGVGPCGIQRTGSLHVPYSVGKISMPLVARIRGTLAGFPGLLGDEETVSLRSQQLFPRRG
jgi:hypothetical protein